MANIAVICEGVSEYKIIENIVSRYCETQHILNPIQPKLNQEKSGQKENGGWSRVLSHCNDDNFNELFQFNDYLIIQIDTDSSHITPYSVEHTYPNGHEKSHKRLHAEIKSRLMRGISRELRAQYLPHIIFAICHNEIECWLLPIYYTDNKACKTNNCIKVLNQALSKRNLNGIPEVDKNSPQARKAYGSIFKNMKKRAEINRISSFSYGFQSFIKGLDSIQ